MFGKKKVDLSSYLDDEPKAKIENNEDKVFTKKVDTSALKKTQIIDENKLEEKPSDFKDEEKIEENKEKINYNYETFIFESKEENLEKEEEVKEEEKTINYNYEVNVDQVNSEEEVNNEEEEKKKEEKNKKYINLLNWDVRKTVKKEEKNEELEKKEETEEEKQKRYDEITSKVEIDDEKLKKIENDVELFGNYTSDYKEKEVGKSKNDNNDVIKVKKIMTPKQKIILIVSIIIVLLLTAVIGLFFTEKNGITNFGLFIKEIKINEELEQDDLNKDNLIQVSEWKMSSKNVNGYDITFEERDNYLDKEYRFNDEIYSSMEKLDISINKYLEELIGENEELTKEEIESMIREKIIRIYLQRTINR